MIEWFCQKYLSFYFRFLSNYWLAIWSAPYKESAWKSLRITIRKGEFRSEPVIVIKKGTV